MQKAITRFRLYPALALLVVLCGTNSVWAQQPTVTISGRVTDQLTGIGMPGVAITGQGNLTGTRVAISDFQGNYTLPFGANTSIKVRAYKTSFSFFPLLTPLSSSATITGTRTVDFFGTFLPVPTLIFPQPPILLTEDESLNALVLDNVLNLRDPFPIQHPNYFGPDKRTRLTLFLVDLDLFSGETLSIISVQVRDPLQRIFFLPVEDLRKVPNFPWLSQLTVRLTNELAGLTDITISVSARGQPSPFYNLRLR